MKTSAKAYACASPREWAALLLALSLCACATSKPSAADPYISQMAGSARAAYERGAYPQAARFYELALSRARQMDDSREIANGAYNLAACNLLLGKPDEARRLLADARYELLRQGQPTLNADLLDAKAARALGLKEEARTLLQKVSGQTTDTALQRVALLESGEWACDEADVETAKRQLGQAGRIKAPGEGGADERLAGRIQMLEKNYVEAANAFDRAAAAYQRQEQYREMAGALRSSGEAFQAEKNDKDAADRFYRAARSYSAQDDAIAALQCIDSGLAASSNTDENEVKSLLTELLQHVKKSVSQAQ